LRERLQCAGEAEIEPSWLIDYRELVMHATTFSLPVRQVSFRTCFVILALMAMAAVGGFVLKPTLATVGEVPQLESVVPGRFGHWVELPNAFVQVPLSVEERQAQESAENTYDQIVSRTYADGQGHRVMLSLAYIKSNRQEGKIHRPELCYIAQGFRVENMTPQAYGLTSMSGVPITGKRMLVRSPNRLEAVSYWIRLGTLYSESAWQTRLYILKVGLEGLIPDGILVRASQIVPPGASDSEIKRLYQVQEAFMQDLIHATPAEGKSLLAR